MSVRFDVATDHLLRGADLIDYNSPYTWMAWIYLVSDLNTNSTLWSLNPNASTSVDTVWTHTDGTTLACRVSQGAASVDITGTNLSLATWYHVAGVRESVTSFKLYLNGVLEGTNTQDITGRGAAVRMEHGSFRSNNLVPSDSRVDRIKAWSAALTIDEIKAEVGLIRPQRTANLYGFWPTFSGSAERLRDYSGNGRSWTESGTLTDEDPAPVSWGSQSTRLITPAAAAANTVKYRRTLSALGTRTGSRQGI